MSTPFIGRCTVEDPAPYDLNSLTTVHTGQTADKSEFQHQLFSALPQKSNMDFKSKHCQTGTDAGGFCTEILFLVLLSCH
jgi:hypothetical protein